MVDAHALAHARFVTVLTHSCWAGPHAGCSAACDTISLAKPPGICSVRFWGWKVAFSAPTPKAPTPKLPESP